MGYYRAGFDVIGIDKEHQPNYPFEFYQADAIDVLTDFNWLDFYSDTHTNGSIKRADFVALHASPPCQQYTPLRARQGWKEYPDLLSQVRTELLKVGLPWIIENVPSAPMKHHVTLCGGMFGLRTYRHRRFETSWLIFQPHHPEHTVKTSTKKRRKDFDAGMNISITGDVGSYFGPACMGIDWMNGNELSQAIPPAYTEFIGRQLLEALQ
jgi:DNA (cytosine-5)-methyltransferase 1